MIDLFEQEEITQSEINSLIENQIEESINLDFKAAKALDSNQKKKIEIAKDVSAFANSAGGYIVYGIEEKDHKAFAISPIDGNEFTKEWLEQIIQTRIQRKIEGLKIIPVRIDGLIEKSIYIVKIPESSFAPHMTSDKRYYKRYNFESVQMEEYEIRNLLLRKEKTQLQIDAIFCSKSLEHEEGVTYQKLHFQIENIGNVVETQYKLFISYDFKGYSLKWDPNLNHGNVNHSVGYDGENFLTLNGVSPIFPDEISTMGVIDFGIESLNRNEIIDSKSFKTKLMFSGGHVEREFKLSEVFINNKTAHNTK